MAHGILTNGIVTEYPVVSELQNGQSQLDQAEQNGTVWLYVFPPENFDRSTHYLQLNVIGNPPSSCPHGYAESYNLIPLSQSEIELNWLQFQDEIVDLTPGSPYWQISEWAKTLSSFSDAKTNILGATLAQNESWLTAAIADLKQKAVLINSFSQAQINAIDHCLGVLRVNWRWSDL